jgi:hypothetical protein
MNIITHPYDLHNDLRACLCVCVRARARACTYVACVDFLILINKLSVFVSKW